MHECALHRRPRSTSIPTGLIELAAIHQANLVVIGSSSSGLLGRVGLGSVTERLVHTAAYGGEADVNGLIAASAELAKSWSVPLRIVSFTVRPVRMFAGLIERSAEDLVVQRWSQRTFDDIGRQLDAVRARIQFLTWTSWSAVATTGERQWKPSPGSPATCSFSAQGLPARRPTSSSVRRRRRSSATLRYP